MPTRKIADLPRVCRHPEHNPPNMMVYENGVWEHVCPACGAKQTFVVNKPCLSAPSRRRPNSFKRSEFVEFDAVTPLTPLARWGRVRSSRERQR